MKRQYMRAVCAAGAITALACGKDPTASLRGGPYILSVTPTVTFVDADASVALVVIARDQQLNPVPVAISATSANAAIATVEVDTARLFPDGATAEFLVTGVAHGSTTINITAAGLTGSTKVTVN